MDRPLRLSSKGGQQSKTCEREGRALRRPLFITAGNMTAAAMSQGLTVTLGLRLAFSPGASFQTPVQKSCAVEI